MNKLELIQNLKEKCRLSRDETAGVVEIFFSEITKDFVSEDRIEIRGFCSFFVEEYKRYTGRNPKTGEKVAISPKKLPFFRFGKELKERVIIQEI